MMNARTGFHALTLAFGMVLASSGAWAQDDAAVPDSAVVQDAAAPQDDGVAAEQSTPVETAEDQTAPPPVAAAKPAKADLNRSPARPRALTSNQPTRAATVVSTRPVALPRILGTYR